MQMPHLQCTHEAPHDHAIWACWTTSDPEKHQFSILENTIDKKVNKSASKNTQKERNKTQTIILLKTS